MQLQMQQQMRLFRAQRNFYIVGFTLFLCLVIKRLLELIIANDNVEVRLSLAKLCIYRRLLFCRRRLMGQQEERLKIEKLLKIQAMEMSAMSSGEKYKR